MAKSSTGLNLKARCRAIAGVLVQSGHLLRKPFDESVETVSAAILRGRKILAFGNGGSAADAEHFAGEFVGRFLRERRGLPAIALSTQTAAMTAIGNDYGFEFVFARSVQAFGEPGDVAIGISTSGRSKNVLSGLQEARKLGLSTIALTGSAGLAEDAANIVLAVPSSRTYEIQEVHKVLLHSLCEEVERRVVEIAGEALPRRRRR